MVALCILFTYLQLTRSFILNKYSFLLDSRTRIIIPHIYTRKHWNLHRPNVLLHHIRAAEEIVNMFFFVDKIKIWLGIQKKERETEKKW